MASVEHELSGGRLLGFVREIKGGAFSLRVASSRDYNIGDLHHLLEREDIVNVLVQVCLGDSIQVLAKSNFFLGELSEFIVGEADANFVVDIGPLRSEVVGLTVIGVAVDEVRSLIEIGEFKLLLKGALLTETPGCS